MSPQTGSRRYTHTYLNRFVGALVFSIFFIVGIFIFYFLAHFPLQDFLFIYFFFRVHKKHKNVNKRISNFFLTQMFFKRIFYFCSLICVQYFCLVAFLCFLYFLCFFVLFGACKIFSQKKKNNKKFKTILMTSFILLLNSSYYKREFFSHCNLLISIFFNYHNLFQLSQFFSLIAIFSIITIFFNYSNFFNYLIIFTTCDTIFMKISQRTNSII